MKFKVYIMLATFLLVAQIGFAQDRSNYYSNLFNPFLSNPAYAGYYNNVHANLNARTMVGGIENSARTLNFGLHAPVGNSSGLGIKVINNWVGAFKSVNMEGAYSKMVKLKDNHLLTFGLSIGFLQSTLNEDVVNSYVNMTDPNLIGSSLNKPFFTAGAGVVYQFKNRLELFASSPMMVTGGERVNGFFITGGNYKFYAGENNEYTIKPAFNYFNFTSSPKQVDLLVTGGWNDIVSLTTGYRTNGAVVGGIGFNFRNVVLGYNYYHFTANLNRLAPAQNEISIAFNFKQPESRLNHKKEVANEALILDEIEKLNVRLNGLINIEKTNPGVVNVKSELTKINRDLGKILDKYKIENMDHLMRIKELQTNIDLLIAKYNDK